MLFTSRANSTLTMSRLKPWCGGVPSALCSTWYAMPVCDAIIVSTISRMLRAVAIVVTIILNVRCCPWARVCCVRKLPNISWRPGQCTYSTEKSGLRDMKRADFIRYWRRSGLKNPDKPKIFIKKNVRNHSYHQFYPGLAKIRINRSLL